ncbi:MAG TPA: M56 family metallopeptidase [Verrucomicrobiae bacterium]|nr:M56 family metallopeptidase [Verrucomicrobiae bacterium]
MKNEILTVCNQLVAAAVNGVYQGLIITILVALCLRWLVRTNAATRHAVWFGTLLLLVGLVGAHGLIGFSSFRSGPPDDTTLALDAELTVPSPEMSKVNVEDGSADSVNIPDDWSRAEQHPLLVLIQAQEDSVEEVDEPERLNSVEPGNAPDADSLRAAHVSNGTTNLRALLGRLLNPISMELAINSRFSSATGILVALWMAIAVARILTLVAQLARIRKTKRESQLPGSELRELFHTLCARMITRRKVQLRVSRLHRSSFLLGFRHPVILLPAAERMALAETELVLRHELAHVERRDDWANLIQHFVLAIFFFHPAFWWISRELSLEREIACDDHVLQQSKRPQAYALVLANLAARMQKPLPLPAPGSSNHKTQLKERIDMILNTRRNASPRLAKTWLALITSTAAIVAIAIGFGAPRIVLAETEPTSPGVAAPPAADLLPGVEATEAVPAIPVAGLPHPGSAGNVPPPPIPGLPPAVSAGPKFKGGSAITLSTSPAVITGPHIALPPVEPRLTVTATVPGQPPSVLASVEPPSAPGAPRAPRPAKVSGSGTRDSSLEERLDRLERMVNSLMHQQSPKGRFDSQLKLKGEMIDRNEMARIEDLARRQAELARLNAQEVEKIKEQAKREAGRAVEQAKRATAEAEKARIADKEPVAQKLKGDSQRQVEELRRQIEALEQRREKLEREIERLQENRDNLDEEEDDSADPNTEPRESSEVSVTESHSHSAQ